METTFVRRCHGPRCSASTHLVPLTCRFLGKEGSNRAPKQRCHNFQQQLQPPNPIWSSAPLMISPCRARSMKSELGPLGLSSKQAYNISTSINVCRLTFIPICYSHQSVVNDNLPLGQSSICCPVDNPPLNRSNLTRQSSCSGLAIESDPHL